MERRKLTKMDTLKKVAQDYGLTPDGVRYALSQYQKVIEELTGGMLSKLNYTSEAVCECVKARVGNQAHLKRWLEMVLSNTNPLDHKARAAFAECLAKVNAMENDVKPVVHGQWEMIDTTVEQIWRCSICGYPCGIWTAGSKYCPNCGAKMDQAED